MLHLTKMRCGDDPEASALIQEEAQDALVLY
jgi:hypothetical protein